MAVERPPGRMIDGVEPAKLYETLNYGTIAGTFDQTKQIPSVAKRSRKERYLTDLIDRLDRSWAAGTDIEGGENLIPKAEVLFMCEKALEIIKSEPNLLEVELNPASESKLIVVGDTHGQFYDLLTLIRRNGLPSNTNQYIFNGDFVDRGPFSFQVIFLLLCFKALRPNSVFLLRGNHESESMNKSYGFMDEILAKYDYDVMQYFWKIFRNLPLAASVSKRDGFKCFVVHGGICDIDLFEEINSFDRSDFVNLSKKHKNLMIDLLWSDPMKVLGRKKNKIRGAGSHFGPDQTRKFCSRNDFDLIVRSHQVMRNGFSFQHNNLLLTLFSCPNYCDSHNNKGAYLVFNNDSSRPQVKQFIAVEHPPLETMMFKKKLLSKSKL